MDESGPNESRQPSTGKSEENNGKDQHTDGDAIAENQEQTTDFVILDIDCIEEAFEYWPIEDVDSMGERLERFKCISEIIFMFIILFALILFIYILIAVDEKPSYSTSL